MHSTGSFEYSKTGELFYEWNSKMDVKCKYMAVIFWLLSLTFRHKKI